MEDRILQVRKIKHSRLYNRVRSISYEGKYQQVTHNLLIKEKCPTGHNQDNIRVSTHCSTRDVKGMEGSNQFSRTRI